MPDKLVRVGIDSVSGTASVIAAKCLATALILAETDCGEEGYPLTMKQRATIAEAMLLAFDGFRGEIMNSLEAEGLLDQLRPRNAEEAARRKARLASDPADAGKRPADARA